MRKTSNILLTIGTVLSFVMAASLLITSIIFFALTSSAFKEIIVNGLQDGSIQTDLAGTPEEIAAIIQTIYAVAGAILIVVSLFAIINGIIAIIGKKKATKGLYILNIIFGAISCVEVNLIGGIFGLIGTTKKQE